MWFGVLICSLCSEISFSSHLCCFIIYYSLVLLNSSYYKFLHSTAYAGETASVHRTECFPTWRGFTISFFFLYICTVPLAFFFPIAYAESGQSCPIIGLFSQILSDSPWHPVHLIWAYLVVSSPSFSFWLDSCLSCFSPNASRREIRLELWPKSSWLRPHVDLEQWQPHASPATGPQSQSPDLAQFPPADCVSWTSISEFTDLILVQNFCPASFKLLQNQTKPNKVNKQKTPQTQQQHYPHTPTPESCWHFITLNVVRHPRA